MVAAAEAGQDFVADGAGLGGHCVDRIVRTDEIGPLPRLRLLFRDVADVDRQEIHGDSADNGRAAVAEIDTAAIGEGAHETVRITDPDCRQLRLPSEAVGRTITNGATIGCSLRSFRTARRTS